MTHFPKWCCDPVSHLLATADNCTIINMFFSFMLEYTFRAVIINLSVSQNHLKN